MPNSSADDIESSPDWEPMVNAAPDVSDSARNALAWTSAGFSTGSRTAEISLDALAGVLNSLARSRLERLIREGQIHQQLLKVEPRAQGTEVAIIPHGICVSEPQGDGPPQGFHC